MNDTIWAVGALSAGDGGFSKGQRGETSIVGFVPPESYCDSQPAVVPVVLGHSGREVGSVAYLERSKGSLWAVARIDPSVRDEDGPLFWSAGITCAATVAESIGAEAWTRTVAAKLRHVALVDNPAGINLGAVQIVDALSDWPTNGHVRPVCQRAHAWLRAQPFAARWERARPLPVVDLDLAEALTPPPAERTAGVTTLAPRQQPLRRVCGQVLG